MNPLVQPDLGLYIWTIVTFLLLLCRVQQAGVEAVEGDTCRRGKTRSASRSTMPARRARSCSGCAPSRRRCWPTARAEADTILARTREDANRFRDEMKQKAQGEAADIVKNAERRIEMETARALQQIRAEAVEFSVAIASKILQRNVSKEDNERLIEETFRQIESTRPS